MKAAYAQVDIGDAFPIAKNFPTLADLVTKFFPRILLVAGIIFFIMTIGAGLTIITSAGGGDPHQQERARSFFTYSIIGMLIIFGAFWILQIINFITSGSLQSIIK